MHEKQSLHSTIDTLQHQDTQHRSTYEEQIQLIHKQSQHLMTWIYACHLLYRIYIPIYHRFHELSIQKQILTKHNNYLLRIYNDIQELLKAMTINESMNRKHISLRSGVIAVIAMNRWIKLGHDGYGKNIHVRGFILMMMMMC